MGVMQSFLLPCQHQRSNLGLVENRKQLLHHPDPWDRMNHEARNKERVADETWSRADTNEDVTASNASK